jgi:hypothetical protein
MKFEEWLYENENYSLRLERLQEEVPTASTGRLIKWLEAAYKVGYEHRDIELMDDGK